MPRKTATRSGDPAAPTVARTAPSSALSADRAPGTSRAAKPAHDALATPARSATDLAARKGAMRRADVSPAVRAGLNDGTLEARTLSESLVVDFAELWRNVVPEAADDAGALADEPSFKQRFLIAGRMLARRAGAAGFARFAGHTSDTVRGWAAFLLAELPRLSPAARLQRIRPLADDRNAGVRETAWMALRPLVAESLPEWIAALLPWTADPSPNIRRFAVEITRPCGVWCAHLTAIKDEPALGLPLLEPVRADPAKYVQDSAANWLNDASKSQPAWVRAVCRRWSAGDPPAATRRIVRRALRTIGER